MICLKTVFRRRGLTSVDCFKTTARSFARVSIFLLLAAFLNVNLTNAQSAAETSDLSGKALSLPGDVDSSFAANLFTTVNQGNRATVTALARQTDGKILITGNFNYVNGNPETFFARLNGDGTVDTRFNPPGFSPIQKIFQLADGKILVAGTFANTFNGATYRGLARLNEDGSIDSSFNIDLIGAGFSGVVDFALQPDGKIIIGGVFTQINGFSINRVARLNTDGSVDTSFQVGSGTDNSVSSVAVQPDGKVLIGGTFATFNNIARPRVARLNADGSLDAGFSTGSGPSGNVSQIIVQPNGKILIGGTFNSVNGVARGPGIARLEANGALDASFAPTYSLDITPGVRLALQPDGKILVGFNTSALAPPNASTFYRYNADGTLDTTFVSVVNSAVTSIVVEDDGKIITGGVFSQVNGVPRNALVRFNPNGTTDGSFNYLLSFAGSATKIAVQNDGKILVAGNFEYVNDTQRNGLARLKADGTIDETFNVTGNFTVNGVTNLTAVVSQADGKILIGGNFTNVNGQTVNRIARLKADGTLDTDFNVGTGSSAGITGILIQMEGKILVFGFFSSFNGAARQGIVRLNQNGSVDATFNTQFASFGFSGSAQTLQADGKILVGGTFSFANGAQRRGIMRLNTDGSLDETFNTLADGAVFRSIVVQTDGKILVGGSFNTINGVTRRNIARLNADGSVDSSFATRSGTSSNGIINEIIVQPDGKILIGGDFITFSGVRRLRIARLNPNGSLDDFNPADGPNGAVLTMALQPGGRLLIGGSFNQFGGLTRVGIARIKLPGAAFTTLFDFDGDGKTDFAVFRASSGAWYRINSSTGNSDGRLFGLPTDRIVPGDYDGDGRADIAVWRPASGQWFILKSTSGELTVQQFGANGDVPLAADYDGDGRDDLAVFRPSTGNWYILGSASGFRAVQFGVSTDAPVIGDFDGDSKADIAVWRPSNGTWYILPSGGGFSAVSFGTNGDVPVTGDYDGDGKTDYAVYRPSNNTWYLLRSAQGFASAQFGASGDRPVAGDYDGDGRTDIAVYRPSNSTWYIAQSSNNAVKSQAFGADGDTPIPAAYLPR